MNRAIPIFNKTLMKKWDESNQKAHNERLSNIRPTVRIETPAIYAHLKSKSKKHQIEGDLFMKINRENKLLQEKLYYIENKPPKTPSTSKSNSLNKIFFKEQQRKIHIDNEILLNRIEKASTSYSVSKFMKERERTERTIKNLCEFPYALGRSPSCYSGGIKTCTNQTSYLKFDKQIIIGGRYFLVKIQKNER